MMDGTIRIFDVASQKCLYAFFNHRAGRYSTALAVSPPGTGNGVTVVAGNKNGMTYVLRPFFERSEVDGKDGKGGKE